MRDYVRRGDVGGTGNPSLFAAIPRPDAPNIVLDPNRDPRPDFAIGDGECPSCGHYSDHSYCENCSPSCPECGEETESEGSLCDRCQMRADEDYYDQDEEDND